MNRLALTTLILAAALLHAGALWAGIDSTFTYQGRLDSGGQPHTGTVDLEFRLYEAATGGSQVGPAVTLDAWPVTGGLFQAELDFGAVSFGSPRWLQIEVDGEVLMPRQRLTAVPLASHALNVGGGDSVWTVSGSDIYYDGGNVGIGTASPGAALQVNGSMTVGDTNNTVSGGSSFVSGSSNEASNGDSFVGGGQGNVASGANSFVGGGITNVASGTNSFIGGGTSNLASGDRSFVGGGLLNTASANFSFAAGRRAKAEHDGTFVWADGTDADFASTGNDQFLIRAGGGVGINTTNPGAPLQVNGSVITGSSFNTAAGNANFVGGGEGNTASNFSSFVGGGDSNTASGTYSFVGGGLRNEASGQLSFVGGGVDNVASGTASFAAGSLANAAHDRTFVWSGTQASSFTSTGVGQFLIQAVVGINTNNPGAFDLAVNGTAAKPGGGSWSVFSDARLKHDIEPLAPGILDRLLSLKGYSFEYTAEAVASRLGLPGRQVGLLAQEVAEVFPEWVDEDDEGYLFVTERGTTAIMVEALRELRARNVELEERVAALESLLLDEQ